MKSLKTISIGIPAYNEELNIKILLERILNQKVVSGAMIEVIVIADGCTDGTIEKVKSLSDSRIRLIEFTNRKGLITGQNTLVKEATGDILVMLDGDVLPEDENFIEGIIEPILTNQKVGLVGANQLAAKPEGFFEKVVTIGHQFRGEIFEHINSGNNIYLCPGAARAFSKDYYKTIIWPENFCEDTYSYLDCLTKGFEFRYAKKARFIKRMPANFKDHAKQSLRFVNDFKSHHKNFDDNFAKKEAGIPKRLILKYWLEYFLKHPVFMVCYTLVLIYTRILSFKKQDQKHSLIDPPSSTKKVI